MYRVRWDPETNGVLLSEFSTDDEITPPRPVFHEELDLLGFNNFWKYRKTEKPLLWAVGRRYYYQGNLVAEAKGGNIFERPEINLLTKDVLALEPVDVDTMIQRNRKALLALENEAMEYITKVYEKYTKHVEYTAVSFSGGKDSQVVLDLVSRVLSPGDYIVVFSDTTMELPDTYWTVSQTELLMRRKYPEIRFYTVQPTKDALLLWRDFGPPSRVHRWCCTVTKTVPFDKLIRSLHVEQGHSGVPRMLVFEGSRREESKTRSGYSRAAMSVKHIHSINARPIIDWNQTEVMLYLMTRGIQINPLYRSGATRVGCTICPFATGWSEFIIGQRFPQIAKRYVRTIQSTLAKEVKELKDMQTYIKEGQWKTRSGGNILKETNQTVRDIFQPEKGLYELEMFDANENLIEWLKVLGLHYRQVTDSLVLGELAVGGTTYNVKIEKKHTPKNFRLSVSFADERIVRHLRRIANKTTYCVHCEACEVQCPTGALQTFPRVQVDTNKCISCLNCLYVFDQGCLLAKSIKRNGEGVVDLPVHQNLDRYRTFGLRREWLNMFLSQENFSLKDSTLGPKQKESLKRWLTEGGLLNPSNNTPTHLAEILRERADELDSWSIVWVNLYYSSPLIEWYTDRIPFGSVLQREDLMSQLRSDFPASSDRTLQNALTSLFQTLEDTPLGAQLKLGIVQKSSVRTKTISKIGTDNPPTVAVVYSLFSLAKHLGRYDFTIADLYKPEVKGGPYRLFGVSKDALIPKLVAAQEKTNCLRVEFTKGLQNLHLDGNLDPLKCLEMLL
ncbi:phosphoadenosine phosphosulfate reductase family protein [Coprothermobacteraceae bacterium]|nr:phosphoadenosine phosphosulfate reductase family protein [Coprothermobacteraceae bacterium]